MPISTFHTIRDPGRIGRIRRLDRCATEDGFLAVAAIDHPTSLLAASGAPWPSADEATVLKLQLIEALAVHASGLLLDPVHSIAQAVAGGQLPGSRGLIANIDQVRETPTGLERTVDLRPGWTPRRIADSGADGAKYVFFHRQEHDQTARDDLERVEALVADCHAAALPCIVEPIWFALDDEDLADAAVRRARAKAIVDVAARFAALGADVLKVQFPGETATTAQRADAAAACRDLDDALEVPWVLLSEGVGYDDFRQQVEVASTAGASGFMVGRSVWSEAAHGGADPAALALVRDRMGELVQVLRAAGRPWREHITADRVHEFVEDGWWATDA